MTNSAGTPPGWYYASGDPAGTQRYWDGSQWVGEPQPVPAQPAQAVPPGYGAPGASPYSAPAYGAPQANLGMSAPAGYVPFTAAAPSGAAALEPGPIGRRIGAYFIDLIPYLVLFGIIIAAAVVLGDSSAPITVALGLASLVYAIWNYWWRRGRTGQSLGDSQMGLKLVNNDTAEPPGFWPVVGRFFLVSIISNFTCGIFGLLDLLWPLWDDRNQRLGDKMLSMTVVVA